MLEDDPCLPIVTFQGRMVKLRGGIFYWFASSMQKGLCYFVVLAETASDYSTPSKLANFGTKKNLAQLSCPTFSPGSPKASAESTDPPVTKGSPSTQLAAGCSTIG